jgi:hypothetical protein
MKQYTGWAVAAGLVVAVSAANAQMLAPNEVGKAHYQATSDVQGPRPYASVPPQAPATRYGPALLPPQEVYTVLRENGFSPLGIPHQSGYVYVIAVVDRLGEDGRLMIDGRNGQIIRFMPTFRTGGYYGEDYRSPYGPSGQGPYGAEGPGPYGTEGPRPYGTEGPRPYGTEGPRPYGTEGPGPYDGAGRVPYGAAGPRPYGAVGPGADAGSPPMTNVRGVPRPPGLIPRVASRTVPVPAPKPEMAVKRAQEPAQKPVQQSAVVQAKPVDTPAAPPPPAPIVVQAKPAPTIQPTQEMPKVQGLE